MGQIPTFTNDRSAFVGAPGAHADVAAAGAVGAAQQGAGQALAGAATGVGAEAQAFTDRYVDARRQSDANAIAADATAKLGDAQFRWSKTPDMLGAVDGFNSETAKIKADALAATSDPLIQNYVTQHLDNQINARRDDTRSQSFSLESSARRGALDQRLQTYAQAAATATNPLLRQQMTDAADLDIAGSVKAGWVKPEDAIQHGIKFKSRVDEVAVRGLMTADPDQAYAALSDPRAFPNMDEKMRAQLLDTASHRSIAQAEKLDRDAAKNLKKTEDDTAKTGNALWADDKLTRGWIDANRNSLSKADYAGFLTALASGPAKQKNDPDTVAALEPQMDDGDIRPQITRAYQAGNLSDDTYRSMMSRNAAARKDDNPASPYRSGRSQVEKTLDPGSLLSGPAAAIGRAGQAQALVEFDNWAAANPKAPRADALAAAQDTVKRYQALNYNEMSVATGLPQGFTGNRQTLDTNALDTAEESVVRRLTAGEISRETADLEGRKIETWRHILAARSAPTPGAK